MRVMLARVNQVFLAICLASMLGCGSSDETPTASIDPDQPKQGQSKQGQPPRDDGQSRITAEKKPVRDPNHPVVQISTTMGDIVVRLNAEKAPITAKHFLWHAGNRFYEGTIFHQVIDGYIVLGGGYTEDLQEKVTHFKIRNEAYNGLNNKRYTIAMARIPDEIDSSTTQFFFNLADNDALNHASDKSAAEFGYCVFGEVISGTEVLERMSKVPVADRENLASVPVDPITIKSVTEVY